MKQYSEKDIQEYAAGTFEGDRVDIENYIESDPAAARTLQLYKLLSTAISEEEVVYPIAISDKVLLKIVVQQKKRELWWSRISIAALFLIVVISITTCFQYFGIQKLLSIMEIGMIFFFCIVIVAFACSLHFIDVLVKKKKYSF